MCICCRLVVLLISRVAHELHPPEHLSYSKEPQNLRSDHTCCGHLLSVEVSDSTQESFWRVRGSSVDAFVEHASRVTEEVDNRLRVLLESGNIAVIALLVCEKPYGLCTLVQGSTYGGLIF